MKSTMPNLKRHFGYPKFTKPPFRFLTLQYNYHMQSQLIRELKRRGHLVREIELPEDQLQENVLRQILEAAVEFKPDALLTLNNMGLDSDGIILNLLAKLGVPSITWFMDSIRATGPVRITDPNPLIIAFSTDKAQLPIIERTGFYHAFYLPLCTTMDYGSTGHNSSLAFMKGKTAYVGATFSHMVKRTHTPLNEELYRAWDPDFSALKSAHGGVNLDQAFAPFQEHFDSIKAFHQFITYVVFRETLKYRIGRLKTLAGESLAVVGTREWEKYLPGEMVFPRANYLRETPHVYRYSTISMNLTTFQLETGLSQRLFDVPICNGFLMTDWKESIADHFEMEEEVVTFHNDEELLDKVAHYRRNPWARARITEKARNRILKEHLIEHRVTELLDKVTNVVNRI